MVVAFTTIKLMSIGHPGEALLHLDVARTDAEGVYRMPGWLQLPIPLDCLRPGVDLSVCKAGLC